MITKQINLHTTLPLDQLLILANKVNTDIALSNTKFIKIELPKLIEDDDAANTLATAKWLNDVTDEEANSCLVVLKSAIVVNKMLMAILDINQRYISMEPYTLEDINNWLDSQSLNCQFIYTNKNKNKKVDLSLPIRFNFTLNTGT